MESRDFSSIIHSPSFTFLVGPKHTKLTIQSGLAEHVSKPLHNLMNNGHTRESRHRIAVLEDEDVETFVAFCEYAYTGDYKVPQRPSLATGPAPAPAPASRENTPAGGIEDTSATGPSWRGTYRSDSVSSALPPPAPSPPPESMTGGQTVKPEEQMPLAIEEAKSVEAEPGPTAAEAIAEEAEPDSWLDAEEKPATESETHGEAHTEEAELQPEQGEIIECAEPPEQTGEIDPRDQDLASGAIDCGGKNTPDAAEPGDGMTESVQLFETPAKKKKSKKAKRKEERALRTQQREDELPASLTPPSTPPPQNPETVEIQTDSVPEQADIPKVEAVDTEPAALGRAAPVQRLFFSYMTFSKPSPSANPEEDLEWPKSPELEPKEDRYSPGPQSWTPSRANTPIISHAVDLSTSPKPVIDMSFAKQSDPTPRTPGLSLWDEFAALTYDDYNSAIQTRQKPANSTSATASTEIPYLTFHAKVYVFATRYLIPALAQLCLHKLHSDLLRLPLGDDRSEETHTRTEDNAETNDAASQSTRSGISVAPALVLDVLHYAYTKTTRLEPISPTSATQLRENELRRLLVHYAACRVKELARWHGGSESGSVTPAARGSRGALRGQGDMVTPGSLRALLDRTPELASDLVYRMM